MAVDANALHQCMDKTKSHFKEQDRNFNQINSFPIVQNGSHFTGDIFRYIFMNE